MPQGKAGKGGARHERHHSPGCRRRQRSRDREFRGRVSGTVLDWTPISWKLGYERMPRTRTLDDLSNTVEYRFRKSL